MYTVPVEMPTQVVNLAEDEALASLPPEKVQVQVRGEGIKLFGLRSNPPSILVNAEDTLVVLDNNALQLPPNVSYENISPRHIFLEKEPRVERKVPIQLSASIIPASTYDFVRDPVIVPDSVVISGAGSIVNSLRFWPTEYIEHEDLRDSLIIQVALSDTLAGLVERDVIETTLTARAETFTEDSRELVVAVEGVQSSERVVTLVPPIVTVKYRVSLGQYDAAREAMDFFASVSYETIRIDTTGRVRPQITWPSGLNLKPVGIEPATLNYLERLIGETN